MKTVQVILFRKGGVAPLSQCKVEVYTDLYRAADRFNELIQEGNWAEVRRVPVDLIEEVRMGHDGPDPDQTEVGKLLWEFYTKAAFGGKKAEAEKFMQLINDNRAGKEVKL